MISRFPSPRAFAFAIVVSCCVSVFASAEIAVSVHAGRPEALYHAGERVTFVISVERDGTCLKEGELSYILSNDGWKTLDTGTLTLSDSPSIVTGTLKSPGFLRCQAIYKDAEGKSYSARAGAGFDPKRIKPSMPVPEDFDAFWAEKKKALAKVRMNPRLTAVDSPIQGVECFDVQLDCLGGAPVSGYLARPANAKPKSLPAILWTQGAGVWDSKLRADTAAEGMLVLDINAHGIPNGQPKDFYRGLWRGELREYWNKGREDRETSYFLGMFYRLMRAMDFLMAQPEWDGEVLIARGSSQGGGQAIAAAGLNPRVSLLIANVPAMCDHTGGVNGWPRLVPRDEQGTLDPKVHQASRYFDAMNFATRTSAEALICVGFIDKKCRPTTVYAMFGNLPGPKRILNAPLLAHAATYPGIWGETAEALIRKQVQNRKGPAVASGK